jgi:hypothetical protein
VSDYAPDRTGRRNAVAMQRSLNCRNLLIISAFIFTKANGHPDQRSQPVQSFAEAGWL